LSDVLLVPRGGQGDTGSSGPTGDTGVMGNTGSAGSSEYLQCIGNNIPSVCCRTTLRN